MKISSAYTPPPPEGFVSPMTWGIESHVIERFAAAGVRGKISFARDTFTFNFPVRRRTLDLIPELLRADDERVRRRGKERPRRDLQKELEALFIRQNQSGRQDATSIPATFLRVTVEVP